MEYYGLFYFILFFGIELSEVREGVLPRGNSGLCPGGLGLAGEARPVGRLIARRVI